MFVGVDSGVADSSFCGLVKITKNNNLPESNDNDKAVSVSTLRKYGGDLSSLTTTNKGSLIAAINELDSDKEGKTITGSAAPTTSTVAENVGQKYYDSTNDKWYVCKAITPGVDPDPTTYTWVEQAGGPTVVQTTGTSTTDVMSQNAVTGMVFGNGSINQIKINGGTHIASGATRYVQIGTTNSGGYAGQDSIVMGYAASSGNGNENIAIGRSASVARTGSIAIGLSSSNTNSGNAQVAIGSNSSSKGSGSIALGTYSQASSAGEMNIGLPRADAATQATDGYNGSAYRLLTGLYDGQSAHDAATVGQTIGTSETLTVSSWSALSDSDPYDYQATVSVATTIPANGTVELVNDQAALFATHGFAIGAVDATNNTVTIYSIGEPASSVSLNIKVRS